MVNEARLPYFAPAPMKRVPQFTQELFGRERLGELADVLYQDKDDPAAVTRTETAFTFEKVNSH